MLREQLRTPVFELLQFDVNRLDVVGCHGRTWIRLLSTVYLLASQLWGCAVLITPSHFAHIANGYWMGVAEDLPEGRT